MKKIFTLIVAALATMSMFAQVTFNATEVGTQGTSGTGSAVEKTIDGVTLSIDKGYVSVNPQYDVNYMRSYAGAKITISATKNISKIVINTIEPNSETDDKYSAASLTATSGYTVNTDKTVGTWTGNAASVVFSSEKQCRMTSIVVTLGEGGDEPSSNPTVFNVTNGEIVYYAEFSEDGAQDFSVDFYGVKDGEVAAPMVSFDVYSTSATAVAGEYSTDNGNLGTDYSYAYLTDDDYDNDNEAAISSAKLNLTFVSNGESGNIYDVAAEFVIDGTTYTLSGQFNLPGLKAVDTDNDGYYDDYEDYELTENTSGVETVKQSVVEPLSVMTEGGNITVTATEGQMIEVYNTTGQKVYSAKAQDGTNTINGLMPNQVLVVRVGNKSAKAVL